jgi:branched-chain amino acid transport system substrate-binding protein
VDVVKPTAICGIDQNDPSSIDYTEQLRKAFEAENGVSFKSVTYTNDSSKNPTPAVTDAKSQGCDAIYMSTVAPNFAAFVKAAKTVGLDATFIDAGSGYDVSLPKTLGADGNPGALGPNSKGVLVAAELAPVTDDTPGVKEMTGQFDKDGTPANFWSQIGWISAKVFFEGLKQGAGSNDITTPEGALNALKSMQPVDTGQAAVPLTFGPGEAHAPNLGSKVLLVNDGEFELAPGQAEGWTIVDPLPPAEK